MTSALAIIHTWPELRNAEYEVVQRLLGAAANINRPTVLIDSSGNVIWATSSLGLKVGRLLPNGVAQFVISLHFESPRVLDLYSFYAVWQPISFYSDFGYAKSVDKFTSHNDLLSCDSDLADAHAINLFQGLSRAPLQPLPQMFHMVAEPYLAPNVTAKSKLLYIGINWERIGRPKGRFHDALVGLDKKGLTEIYGPEDMFGVAPWAGFQTYQGELPFDGRSVLNAVNRAGVCLALSSAEHKKTGIMSNRIFEGLAGGAAVIATPNPIIDKYFSEVVYLVDDSRGEQVLGQMVLEALRQIRADPQEARDRVLKGQQILRENCSLERSLEHLFETVDSRIEFDEEQRLADAEVSVFLVDEYGSLERIRERIGEYARQRRCRIDLHILCDSQLQTSLVNEAPSGAIRTLCVHGMWFEPGSDQFDGVRSTPERTGPTLARLIASLSTPYFVIAGAADIPFSDHLSSLAKWLERRPLSFAACSGAVAQTSGPAGNLVRTLTGLRIDDLDVIARVNGPIDRGRYMFRTELAQPDLNPLLSLLDGEEHRCFLLAAALLGDLAQTGYASHLRDETELSTPRRPAELVEVQQQCIRDRFANDPRWTSLVSRGHRVPEFVYAYAPDVPIPSSESVSTTGMRPLLEIGCLQATTMDSPGTEHLGAGFSPAEDAFTWLAAHRGVIDFRLPARSDYHDYEVVLIAEGARAKSGRQQHCTFFLNGAACAYLSVPNAPTEIRLKMPKQVLENRQDFRLEIVADHLIKAIVPSDNRMLALALRAFGVMPQFDEELPTLDENIVHGCGTDESGVDVLSLGFYPSEPDLTWVAGTHASVHFRVARMIAKPVLRLRVWGLRDDHGENQTITLSLNRRRLGVFQLPEGRVDLDIPLADAAPIGTRYDLELGLRHARRAIDGNGAVIDGRLLGLAFFGVGIFGEEACEEGALRSMDGSLFQPSRPIERLDLRDAP